jgi:TusA-related sulfurtransferase
VSAAAEPVADVTVDARGRMCPAPVIELARAARRLGTGVVAVLADDPAAATDIPAWCSMRGARLICVADAPGARRYLVAVG